MLRVLHHSRFRGWSSEDSSWSSQSLWCFISPPNRLIICVPSACTTAMILEGEVRVNVVTQGWRDTVFLFVARSQCLRQHTAAKRFVPNSVSLIAGVSCGIKKELFASWGSYSHCCTFVFLFQLKLVGYHNPEPKRGKLRTSTLPLQCPMRELLPCTAVSSENNKERFVSTAKVMRNKPDTGTHSLQLWNINVHLDGCAYGKGLFPKTASLSTGEQSTTSTLVPKLLWCLKDCAELFTRAGRLPSH